MKSFLEKIKLHIEGIQKELNKRKDINIHKLKKVQSLVQKEIDENIDAFYTASNQIKQALQKQRDFKKFKLSAWKQFLASRIRFLISVPFIYSMAIPALILHVFLEFYHQICFRLYQIPLVKPSDYFVFDRRHLAYLNWIEKMNCFYCSYFNCLISYTREIGARTERFWCPIKHAKRIPDPHSQYEEFFDYLDAKEYREKHMKLRDFQEKNKNCKSR